MTKGMTKEGKEGGREREFHLPDGASNRTFNATAQLFSLVASLKGRGGGRCTE